MTGLVTRYRFPILAAGLLGLGFGMTVPAVAADDGYANVFTSLFSAVGVVKPDAPPDISYRERPPLVIPPQPGLPKPGEAPKRTAAWPNDPDVARHRRETDEARAPQGALNDKPEMLSGAELAKGRGGQAEPVRSGDCNVEHTNHGCLVVSPDELKAEGERYSAANPASSDEVVSGQEPTRDYLTQPPKGYLKATRTVKATSEGPAVREDPSNPRYFTAPKPKSDDE